MPQILPMIMAAAGTVGSGLAAAGSAIGTAAAAQPLAAIGTGLSAYNSLVQQPQQAGQALENQKQALGKSNMSEFLRNQILRQQAGQMQNMAQNYGQPDFLKAFLERQNPQNNYYQQGGGY